MGPRNNGLNVGGISHSQGVKFGIETNYAFWKYFSSVKLEYELYEY